MLDRHSVKLLVHQRILRFVDMRQNILFILFAKTHGPDCAEDPFDQRNRCVGGNRCGGCHVAFTIPEDKSVHDFFLRAEMIIECSARNSDRIKNVIGTGLIKSSCKKSSSARSRISFFLSLHL
jgi:hypothetical protein